MTLDELRKVADGMGYELRRKGTRQSHKAVFDADGEQLRNCYLPHLAATASVRARTIKSLCEVSRKFKDAYGAEIDWCYAWEILLRICEHAARRMSFSGDTCRLTMSVVMFIPSCRRKHVMQEETWF